MPELAEVEYYRKQWNCGLSQTIAAVRVHSDKRVFRGTAPEVLTRSLTGTVLIRSEARGKQMLFQFSRGNWLGIHLGMTGKLFAAPLPFAPDKHDHLVLYHEKQALVFNDMRQFGRVLFHQGDTPLWWSSLPPEIASPDFTPDLMAQFLARHPRLPIKAALLLQSGFPGIGNWMADEILWRAGVHPEVLCGALPRKVLPRLWKETRKVCAQAMSSVGENFSDPPKSWLFHQRWKPGGLCPRHRIPLDRATIRGRTAAWCPKCQPLQNSS